MSLPETIPVRREPDSSSLPSYDAGPALICAGLAIALALVWITIWQRRKPRSQQAAPQGLLDRWLPHRLPGDLVVKSSTRLTPHHSVHQVDWNGRRLLIGCANQSITLLSELPPATDAAAKPPTPSTSVGAP